MSDMAQVLEKLASSGKLSQKDKRWITQKITEERDHERNMALIKAFAADPELKYYMGMALGAGVGFIGAFVGQLDIMGTGETPTPPPNEALAAIPYSWLHPAASMAVEAGTVVEGIPAVLSVIAGANWLDSGNGLAGQIGNILALGGVGFAGTCAMILILKAIFSGTDLGELLSGVGEIIPL